MRKRMIMAMAALLVGANMLFAQGVISRPTKPQGKTNPAKKQVSKPTTGTINGYEYVDLGLSVKWATCNIGATTPSGYGNYYAWGEMSPKSEYTEENSVTFGKDITIEKNMGSIAGDSRYDIVRANWGGTWRMPTINEICELADKCKWKWTTLDGHNGYIITGPNGNSIFLPAAGKCDDSSSEYQGELGVYWSSTSGENNNNFEAFSFSFESGGYMGFAEFRYYGRSVRPVSE